MKVQKAVEKLRRATRRLDPEQMRVARMNARAAVRVGLRAVERAMDDEFPIIPKQRKERARYARLSRATRDAIRERKLRKRGYVTLNDASHGHGAAKAMDLTAAGIRALKGPRGNLWVPDWTAEFKLGDSAGLRRAKEASPRERAALVAEQVLKRSGGGVP